MRVADVLAGLGRPVVFHAELARALDSIPAALMLSQLLYWTGKEADGDGWIYKTESEWDDELALGRSAYKNARAELVSLGLIEHARRGMPAKPYYRVDPDRLDEWWGGAVKTARNVPSRQHDPSQHDSTEEAVIPLYKDDVIDDNRELALGTPPPAFPTFWATYPPRDGKRVGRSKAEEQWKKLSVEEWIRALVAARHLADAIEAGGKFGPPDAWRWLRDRTFEDWQEPAEVTIRRTGADRVLPAAERWLSRKTAQ